MDAAEFYSRHLTRIQVPLEEIEATRTKRDGLAKTGVAILREWGLTGVKWFPAGALAMGTQIAPLNDVDLVIQADDILKGWWEIPKRPLDELCGEMGARVPGGCETSTHAVKFTFADEEFTADVVFGATRDDGGLWIPHCPGDEPHTWIETDPKSHRDLVRKRNKEVGTEFAKEVRILKSLNRRWRLAHERKIISSWHLTALALTILTEPFTFAGGTPYFLAQAAELVKRPLPDPARVGPALEAKDAELASSLFAEAATRTQEALHAGPDAGQILEDVFGDPATLLAALQGGALSVSTAGMIGAGGAGRPIGRSRDYGDDT
jgi:hypothetical protein